VGFATADDDGVDLARPIEIIRVAAFAAYQFRIFAAPHRLADAEFGQGQRGFSGSVVHNSWVIRLALCQLMQRRCRDKNSFRDGGLREAETLVHFF
jgi:hypothetical protein